MDWKICSSCNVSLCMETKNKCAAFKFLEWFYDLNVEFTEELLEEYQGVVAQFG